MVVLVVIGDGGGGWGGVGEWERVIFLWGI